MEIWEKPFERSEYVGRAVATDEVIDRLPVIHINHGCHREHALRYVKERGLPLWSHVQFSGNRGGAPHEHCEPAVWTEMNYYNNFNGYGPFVFQLPCEVLVGRTFIVLRRDDPERPRLCFVEIAPESPLNRVDQQFRRNDVWEDVFTVEDGRLSMFDEGIYHFVLTTPASVPTGSRIVSARHPACRRCTGYTDRAARRSLGSLAQEIEADSDYTIQEDSGLGSSPRIVDIRAGQHIVSPV